MIRFEKGDLFKSKSQALVNTVNLEGYMGKGIAYQFKQLFPMNNEAYKRACRTKEIDIGRPFVFKENDRVIINFPTKNKWREKSKMHYIDSGMKSLVEIINNYNIRSISIPPLGCGNGGLNWNDVRELMVEHLKDIDQSVEVLIYPPNNSNYVAKSTVKPKLTASHMVLLQIKFNLRRFSKFRLQKTAYLMNIFSGDDYFKFDKYTYGPYSYPIELLSKDIKNYQTYNKTKDSHVAYQMAMKENISKDVLNKLDRYDGAVKSAADLVNSINSNDELELITSIHIILKKKPRLTIDEIEQELHTWTNRKKFIFSKTDILEATEFMEKAFLISKDLEEKYQTTIYV